MSYVDAVLSQLQVGLKEVSPLNKRTEPVFFKYPKTAAILAEFQTSKMLPKMTMQEDGTFRCTSFDIVYNQADQNTIGSGSSSATGACVIVPDQTFSGLKSTKDIDRFFERKLTINKKACNSFLNFQSRLEHAIDVKMQEIALEWNARQIAVLAANFQTATNQGDFGTGITAGVIDYTYADLIDENKFEQRLVDWGMIGEYELLPQNMLVLNGQNFLNVKNQAEFNALNDNQRSQAAHFGSMNIGWDTLGFATASIRKTSFLIDPNAYCVITRNQYTTAPVNEMNATNDRTWSMPLTYLDENMVRRNLTYKEGNATKNLMVDMRLQLTCNAADAVDGIIPNDYVLEMRLAAGLVLMPAKNSSTGIVKILAA